MRSVANLTRVDGQEMLALAPRVPVAHARERLSRSSAPNRRSRTCAPVASRGAAVLALSEP